MQWKEILNGFEILPTIKLPRFAGNKKGKLLCFADAYGNGYATAVYLLTETDGKPNIELIFSKSRVAPKKLISIPQLKLLGVFIGVRSLKFVQERLKLPVTKKILWTD